MTDSEGYSRHVETSLKSIPIVTVYTIAGIAVWGPEKVLAGMTVADLASKLDRPSGSPGLKVMHENEILGDNFCLEGLVEPWTLTVHFEPPKPYDHSFVKDIINLAQESEDSIFIANTEVAPQKLQVLGAEVTKAVMQSCELDEPVKMTFCVELRLPASSPMIRQRNPEQVTLQLESVKFHGKGNLDLEDEEYLTARFSDSDRNKELARCDPETILVEVKLGIAFEEDDWDELMDCDKTPEDTLFLKSPMEHLKQRHASKLVREGVTFETNAVSEDLAKRLSSLIDQVKSSTRADYHPGTEDVVRDIVHPGLFPYVEGVSKTTDMTDVAQKEAGGKDMWGRPYESSKYQWLPAEVLVSATGKCSFDSYINNLEGSTRQPLYEALEELLGKALPHLESAWSHGSSVEPPQKREEINYDNPDCEAGEPEALEQKSLRGKTIQVIVKIVDYELPPWGVHEGVWHVEGMSHENIVATAELILQKDAALKGGDLEFQRSFTSGEGGDMIMSFPQDRPHEFDEVVSKGLVPLGHLPLPCGRLASWPNSHIHRVTRLENTTGEAATRRIIVFWLVNPEKRIVSTKHVPPQQGSMSLEDALKHRLALMEERKYHKQAWNLREVTLCEH